VVAARADHLPSAVIDAVARRTRGSGHAAGRARRAHDDQAPRVDSDVSNVDQSKGAAEAKERSHRLRERIKRLCRRTRTGQSLHDLLRDLNWLLQGWSPSTATRGEPSECSARSTTMRGGPYSVDAQEASVRIGESVEGVVLTLEGARDPPGTVAPSWGHAVRHRQNPRQLLPAGFGPPSSLRESSGRAGWINERCTPGSEGGARNLPARAGKAPGAYLTRR